MRIQDFPLFTATMTVFTALQFGSQQPAVAQGVHAQWLTRAGSTAPVSGISLATDFNTNIFVLGRFAMNTTIGTHSLSTTEGVTNVFLTKFRYQSSDAPLWSVAPTIEQPIVEARHAALPNGMNAVAGSFSGSSLGYGSAAVTNAGDADIFVAGIDTLGNVAWLQRAGGSAKESFADIGAERSFGGGAFYLAGTFESASFTFGDSTLTKIGTEPNCFTVKLDPQGNVAWVRQGTFASTFALTLDAANNCYVAASSLGETSFDGISPASQTTSNVLVKYNSAGMVQWVRGDMVLGNKIKIDAGGNLFTAGSFSNVIHFGSVTLSNANSSTIFVAKYDSDGDLAWARQLPGQGKDAANDIAFDSRTNCWIAGRFASPGPNGEVTNPVAALVCLDPSGELRADAAQLGSGTSEAFALGNTYHPFNGMPILTFVGGSFTGTFSLETRGLTNNGPADLFVGWIAAGPKLEVTRDGSDLVLSWPAVEGVGFGLEATDLSGGGWTSVPNVSFVNGKMVFSTNATSGLQFFRLRK